MSYFVFRCFRIKFFTHYQINQRKLLSKHIFHILIPEFNVSGDQFVRHFSFSYLITAAWTTWRRAFALRVGLSPPCATMLCSRFSYPLLIMYHWLSLLINVNHEFFRLNIRFILSSILIPFEKSSG